MLFFNFFQIFFYWRIMLYRILLFSVKPQHESAISIHISPPLWTSLPFVFAHQEFVSPVLWKSVIKSHCAPKSNSLWLLSPFAWPPDWEICCGSWNFLNSVRILWYNCSAVCGSFAHLLYGGANIYLLQEGLCHTLHGQVCYSQSSCPCGRPLLTSASIRDLKYIPRVYSSTWEVQT